MRCPFGYDDHPVTWRCYAVFALDWLLGRWPEWLPYWTQRPLMQLFLVLETDEGTKP